MLEQTHSEFLEQRGIAEIAARFGATSSKTFGSSIKIPYLRDGLEVNAKYRNPARFEDKLTIKSIIPKMPGAKVTFEYQVFNNKNELLCSGYSLHSFMNLQDRAIKPPKSFLKKIAEYF